jgi:hypothetical protein
MRNLKMRWLMVSGLVLACLMVAMMVAQKSEGQEKKEGTDSQALTDESLKTMLSNMGYEPEEIKATDGSKIYRVTIEKDDWKFVVNFSISPDKSYVWQVALLKTIPDPDKVPAAPLLKMLSENDEIGPVFFSYSPNTKRFYLNAGLENRGVTPARFRKELDRLTGHIKRTAALWDPARWETK